MRRLLALYILVVLLVAGWPPAVEASGGRPGTPVPALPDGYRWSNESQLTNDQAGDLQPQLALGTNGSAGVAWYRNGDLMWKRVDRSGTEITAERVVSPDGYPVQPDGSCAPCIGADQNGTFYLVSEPGGAGVYYSKLSPNGAFLVNHQNVPSGARDPADPVMVVTPKGVAHIIYSDGRFAIGFVDESYA